MQYEEVTVSTPRLRASDMLTPNFRSVIHIVHARFWLLGLAVLCAAVELYRTRKTLKLPHNIVDYFKGVDISIPESKKVTQLCV